VTDAVAAGPGTNQHNIALPWHYGGCAVIPIRPGGSKAPFFDWKNGAKNYQQDRPSDTEIQQWFEADYPRAGVAVICGKVSGNLEMLELEGRAADADSLSRISTECEVRTVRELWEWLMMQGYSEWTPSGGIHLLYRITDHDVPGNKKIASRSARQDELTEEELALQTQRPDFRATRVLAETRGEGGYVVVAPTGGHCHKSGEPWTTVGGQQGRIPEITWSQRMAIHLAIQAALDESPPPAEPVPRNLPAVRTTDDDDPAPGTDFNLRGSWEDSWFTSMGWKVSHRSKDETFWVRPGKNPGDGHSASTGFSPDGDRLFIWSTSTDLPSEEPLSKFFVYAHYHHNGDHSAAARTLRYMGYGGRKSTKAESELREFNLDLPDGSTEAVLLPPQGGHDLTDTGYGRLMHEMYADKFRYNTAERRWYEWDGSAWVQDEHLAIQRAAEATADLVLTQATEELRIMDGRGDELEKSARRQFRDAKAGLNNSRLQAAITRYQCQPGIPVTPDAFDQNQDLLNLGNGTLNLLTSELRPHSPDNMLTLTFGAELDPGASCPLFKQFMADILPSPEVRAYVQRALGYTMLGRPTERVMFLLHGPSGTGKSVLTSVMTQMFGGYGTTAPATTFRIKKNETSIDVHRLRGRRFVATSEMPEGALLDEELIKRLTGGDHISSRSLYEDYQVWTPKCVIWIATNFLPRVNGDDNAIWRRAKSIPMRTEFGTDTNPEILGYASVLMQERNGILNWLLAGLASYQEYGLDQPQEITDDIESYRVDVDSVASFLRDKTDDGVLALQSGATVRSSVLNTLYSDYCAENRVQPMGVRRFAKRLRSLGTGLEPTKVGGQSVWTGLRYIPENANNGHKEATPGVIRAALTLDV
jgi:putative DNA primase/helicase